MAVHVSIHDVAPPWERELDLALDACRAVSVRPALLVVPNFHGDAPLDRAPAFAKRLRALAEEGHEIYLHGFFHKADVQRGGLGTFVAQRVVSGGEAEFAELERDEAARRLDEGLRLLRDVGLAPTGFVAPAWAMPRWLVPMLAERGLTYTEARLAVIDLRDRRERASIPLNYASRSPGRLLSTVAFNRVARFARVAVPARIAIHPADMRFSLLRRELDGLLAWAKGDFVARGEDLVAG